MKKTPSPADTCSEYDEMAQAWGLIDDILDGLDEIRKGGVKYLPKFPGENENEYRRRLYSAPWRPEFADAVMTLAAKPFGRDVELTDADAEPFRSIAEDADLCGNNITQFASHVFSSAVAYGFAAILVEYPVTEPGQAAPNARPYFVAIDPEDIIALYVEAIDGKPVISHARIRESITIREGFGENKIERIRVLEPGIWQLWEEQKAEGGTEAQWVMVSAGTTTIQDIPLVLMFTGEREGSYCVKPPLLHLAHVQIELFRAMSRHEEILTYAGAPMLSANGLTAPDKPIVVGPKAVLFAPPGIDGGQTGWGFVQPDASNIKEIRDHIRSIIDDMRRLGMQPMTQRVGGTTATATSVESAKAHSVLQSWAMALADAIEQCFVFAGQWVGVESKVTVSVDTDFNVVPFAEAPLRALQAARDKRDISLETYWKGLKRFDVLPSDFDPEAEQEAIAVEGAPLVPEQQINPVTG